MPELPEVEAALEFLRARVRGRTIERVRLLHPALQRRLSYGPSRALASRVSNVAASISCCTSTMVVCCMRTSA